MRALSFHRGVQRKDTQCNQWALTHSTLLWCCESQETFSDSSEMVTLLHHSETHKIINDYVLTLDSCNMHIIITDNILTRGGNDHIFCKSPCPTSACYFPHMTSERVGCLILISHPFSWLNIIVGIKSMHFQNIWHAYTFFWGNLCQPRHWPLRSSHSSPRIRLPAGRSPLAQHTMLFGLTPWPAARRTERDARTPHRLALNTVARTLCRTGNLWKRRNS